MFEIAISMYLIVALLVLPILLITAVVMLSSRRNKQWEQTYREQQVALKRLMALEKGKKSTDHERS